MKSYDEDKISVTEEALENLSKHSSIWIQRLSTSVCDFLCCSCCYISSISPKIPLLKIFDQHKKTGAHFQGSSQINTTEHAAPFMS